MLFKKLYAFLQKDTSAENEANDLSIVIRQLSIIFFIYYLTIGTIFLISFRIRPSSISYLASLFMLFSFIYTYYSHTQFSFWTFIISIMICSFTLCLICGTSNHFQYSVFICILLIFFNINLVLWVKYFLSLLICAVLTLLEIIVAVFSLTCSLGTSSSALFAILHTMLLSFSLILISYHFYKKYSLAERKLYLYNKKLTVMASCDSLTGLFNRRYMMDVLTELERDYKRGYTQLSVALGDIDYFKHVNDTYGHACGDYVLSHMSDIFTSFMENKGKVARWGGEEFLFVFTSLNADDAFIQLNELRSMIQNEPFIFQNQQIKITMTFGLEEYSIHGGITTAIKKADEKLYQGKNQGRNLVIY